MIKPNPGPSKEAANAMFYARLNSRAGYMNAMEDLMNWINSQGDKCIDRSALYEFAREARPKL